MGVKIKIKDILEQRQAENKENSMYWLAKEVGVTYPTILNIVKGDKNGNPPKSINFETLEKICNVLNVQLTDIIEFDKESAE